MPLYRSSSCNTNDFAAAGSGTSNAGRTTFREKRATLGSVWKGLVVDSPEPRTGVPVLDINGDGEEFLQLTTPGGGDHVLALFGEVYTMKVLPTHGVALRESASFEDRILDQAGPKCTTILNGKLVRADEKGDREPTTVCH